MIHSTSVRGVAMKCKSRVLAVVGLVIVCSGLAIGQVGRTEITKWQDGKRGAVSLTFDDGSINQFRVAVPIMDKLGFPATFFIITGNIPGSQYHGTFVGRPTRAIVDETAKIPTGKDNIFERASAIGFLGYQGTLDYHSRAGELYDEGKDVEQAYRLLDEAYAKVRAGEFPPQEAHAISSDHPNHITWEELAALAQHGHELASHTVTHPRLAVLDDLNLEYELERSRQDILDHLGFKHIFSVECPYGTENERAVRAALARYQVARNHMPDSWIDDLDRWNEMDPAASHKEYVRWQRGALTKTPMELMKSWVEKTRERDNVWLVLVFHGVDGVGWEPKTSKELTDYFGYIKSEQDRLWVATFQDVTKYMRERMHGQVVSYRDGDVISVVLRSDLTDMSYDLPLTLKTYVPKEWNAVEVWQGKRRKRVAVVHGEDEGYVIYQAVPGAEAVTLSGVAAQTQ
jgi:peptidoglycan/xylan/chitin deacetylase (PgdA/CDA1 family)